MSQKNKPLFITFEGGEGSGKTTLIESIRLFFEERGCDVVKTREPGGTDLGEQVRELLLHQKGTEISPMAELLLFLTSRVQHIQEIILPSLKQGCVVLCDRFNDSSIAYQGHARGLGMDLAQQLCDQACSGLTPDLTFILNLDPSKGLKRIQKMEKEWDRLEDLNLSFHEKVHEGYQILAQEQPSRIFLIDAAETKEKVFEGARGILRAVLQK
ncbi:MAG: Thymidylate kinase [Chlamydiae bacterium]|nr:Thymidylate kinase [Chlamydiota bacterium]